MLKKKYQIFLKISWTAVFLLCSLYAPFAECAEAYPESGDVAGGDGRLAGMSAKVKVKQAETLERLSRVREELDTVQRDNKLLSRQEKTLADEKTMLSRELFEMMDRYKDQNEKYRRLQLSIAATIANEQSHVVSEREDQLLKKLEVLSRNGKKLAIDTLDFCEQIDSLLKKMPLGKLEQARIRVRMDELVAESRSLCSLSGAGSSQLAIERCRLLEVNRNLQVAILPVGAVHGVFNGLIFNFGKGDAGRLRVVAVRPLLAAAVVDKGSIDDLTPGTVVFTSITNKIKE